MIATLLESREASTAGLGARVLEAQVLGLLAYLPFAFGGVLPLSHLVVIVVAAAMAACLGIRVARRQQAFCWSWTYVPIALFLGLVALQLVELPRAAVAVVAPATAGSWTDLVTDPSAREGHEGFALSLYPYSTAADLRLLLAVAVIFVVIVNVYRRGPEIRRLLGWVAITGLAAAVLAILQDLTEARRIFWCWETPSSPAKGGPFVHRGHFCQFVNLAMGCALALLLVRLAGRARGGRLEMEQLFSNLRRQGWRFDLFLVGFLVLGMVSIALAESRNGVISMLVAGTFAAAALHWSRFLAGVGWPLVGLVLVAFVVLLFLGFDPLQGHMGTLEDPVGQYSGRLALLADTLAAWREFPVFGTGQGTFHIAFPMFDTSVRAGWAEHAENQYAELLAETGVIGSGLVLWLVVLVVRAWLRSVRAHDGALRGAVFGLGYGLVAVAFHAVTDFGTRIPAIAVLGIVCAGVIVAIAARPAAAGPMARFAGVALCLGTAGLLAATVPSAVSAWRADTHWREVDRIQRTLTAPDYWATSEQYDQIFHHGDAAVALQPANVVYRFWTTAHRWNRTVAESVGIDSTAGAVRAPVEHTPELIDAARRTQAALLQAGWVGPTHGLLWSLAGQLGVLWLDDPAAGRWIHRGRELAPHRADACLASGLQHLREGHDQDAIAALRRAIQLGTRWNVIFDELIRDQQRVDIASELARTDPRWLVWLAAQLSTIPEAETVVADLRDEALVLIEDRCAQPDPPSWMHAYLAREYAEAGDDERAMRFFRSYLLQDPGSTLRFDLARVLSRMGRIEEARRELRRLLGVHPNHGGGKALLVDLGS